MSTVGATHTGPDPATKARRRAFFRWLPVLGNLLVPTAVIGLLGQALDASPARTATASLMFVVALHVWRYRRAVDRAIRAHWILLGAVVTLLVMVVAMPAARRVPFVSKWMLRAGMGGLSRATGIVEYAPHANDFLPHLDKYIAGSKEEIWFTGMSFYISLPQYRDALAAKAKAGVNVRFLIFDPLSPGAGDVAASFGQSREALLSESNMTVQNLHDLGQELEAAGAGGNFQVRLFSTIPRARIYVFDRHREEGYTFFVPHVGNLNTPLLPGFLVQNIKTGIAPAYFDGLDRAWAGAVPFDRWWTGYVAQRAAAGQPAPPPVSAPARN